MRRSHWLIGVTLVTCLLTVRMGVSQDRFLFLEGQEPARMAASAALETDDLQRELVLLWNQYGRAFEYADYPRIAQYFTFPASFVDLSGQVVSAADSKALIERYRDVRENIQAGYKYSMMDHARCQCLTPSIYQLDVTYGRFNAAYQRIHTGRGLYFFRKTDDGWKMYAVFGLPVDPKVEREGNHLISRETVYYTTGPQQGRAPDGKFPAETVVTILEEAGSYLLVESETGIVGYVTRDSVKPREDR